MGDSFEFNHVLKLSSKDLEGLALNQKRSFVKEGEVKRVYSEHPILAVDENWNAKGYVLVEGLSYKSGEDKVFTSGVFEPVYLFDKVESKVISNPLKVLYSANS